MMALAVLPSKFGLHKSEKKPHPKHIRLKKQNKSLSWQKVYDLTILYSRSASNTYVTKRKQQT